MPDPKFVKPWHGIPREQIAWSPSVEADACTGCGSCVTGCGRLVYRYDYVKRIAFVVDPLNCMVGCTTCANTCPTHAIHFPSLATILALGRKAPVMHAIKEDLKARKEQLAFIHAIPHPDRVLNMKVDSVRTVNDKTLIVKLTPAAKGDCFCQFMPGQFVEIIPPNGQGLQRAYAIGNAPQTGGSIELQIGYAEQDQLSDWLFKKLKKDDVLQVRGPRGNFTMKSKPDRSLVFVAGGTGFAPIKALIEQQMQMNHQRKMELYWGIGSAADVYETEALVQWKNAAPNFSCTVAIDKGELPKLPEGIIVFSGELAEVISKSTKDLKDAEAYVAGPVMMPGIMQTLMDKGIASDHIYIDSFGL
jgi:CDP-4-dehydro-6-deoxyglucose reductase